MQIGKIILIASLVFGWGLSSAHDLGINAEAFIVAAHLSEPFMKSRDVEIDFVGAGGTIKFDKFPGLEIDMALGQRYFGCTLWGESQCGRWTFAFHGQIKWYPLRK